MSVSRPGLFVARLRFFTAALVLAATMFVGGRPLGPVPPLGPFLNPVNGVWSVARQAALPAEFSGVIPGLDGDAQVVYDRRGVPHITASSVEDVIHALGYVVARDRLFQLEVQSRAPQGTLTELLGPSVLQLDRGQRAIGLPWGAERDVAATEPGSQAAGLLRAYAEGINAWIDAKGAGDLPFEYHLLGTEPRRWETLFSSLIGKRMGYTLAYDTQDLWRLNVEALVGRAAADWLFPRHSPIEEPIQPNGGDRPRFTASEPPPPIVSDVGRSAAIASLGAPWPDMVPAAARTAEEPLLGSNNWAVAPSRSATGNALLAGDPHLDLTLPSIWYEVHLIVPGELDVHGVSIPGLPGVIIGFNRDLAWSLTNTGADVVDFYRETFDDDDTPTQYMLDGEWKQLRRRVERYLDPSGDLLDADTVYYTHRGPVRQTAAGPLSMRWTNLENTLSVDVFVNAARASNVDEWMDAMAPFAGPAQNGVVADRQGNIAIRSTGLFPIRPGDGDGLAIRDGSTTVSDWRGSWPLGEYPQAKNPQQGFLASANQEPIDSRVPRRYLGAHWESPWRAMRINALLRADSLVTIDAMMRYQTDPGNEKAELFVPVFLEATRDRDELRDARALLDGWDRRYTKDNPRAILFEWAFEELTQRTWDELVVSGETRVRMPREAVLAGLLQYPESVWWDDRRTTEITETRDDILVTSLQVAFDRAIRTLGDPGGDGWRWSELRHANVYHLLQLPGLSALGLAVQGGPGNLNPSDGSGRHGASWRMVVELGPEVRAWATYPGGQSGNPASPWYVDRLDRWVEGELEEVLFPRTPGALDESDVAGRLTLRRAER